MLKRIVRGVLKTAAWIAGACVGVIVLMLTVLTVAEYRPYVSEGIEAAGQENGRTIREGDRIEILSFNIGYGGLDASMDSFLDGGKQNTPVSREKVEENLNGIVELIDEQTFDVLFLQEVDRDSKRSYHVNESELLEKELGGAAMFAQNYRCLFVPYPIPDFIGQVNSGLQTQTGLKVRSAERVALPTSFKWPVRLCQLKRCLLVTRIPIEDSGRELVLINVHMDAYDDGTGRAEQTEALAELMRTEYEMGNYVIAGGDFNQVFPDDDFSAYPIRESEYFVPGRLEGNMLGEGWTFASDRSAPTCRLLNMPYSRDRWWTQFYVIDGFILSPNVEMESVETIDAEFVYSDHNPVRLTARLGK